MQAFLCFLQNGIVTMRQATSLRVEESIDERVEARRRATAAHEAGHAVAARILGIAFSGVSIAVEGDSAGRVAGVRSSEAVTRCPEATEDYLVYLYAGAAAVRELCAGAVVTGASEDELRAQQAAGFVVRKPGEYRACLERARERARELVRARRQAVEAVASALLSVGELSLDEVDRILAQASVSSGA